MEIPLNEVSNAIENDCLFLSYSNHNCCIRATFSVSGRIIDTYRPSLDPETVQALIAEADGFVNFMALKEKQGIYFNTSNCNYNMI